MVCISALYWTACFSLEIVAISVYLRNFAATICNATNNAKIHFIVIFVFFSLQNGRWLGFLSLILSYCWCFSPHHTTRTIFKRKMSINWNEKGEFSLLNWFQWINWTENGSDSVLYWLMRTIERGIYTIFNFYGKQKNIAGLFASCTLTFLRIYRNTIHRVEHLKCWHDMFTCLSGCLYSVYSCICMYCENKT